MSAILSLFQERCLCGCDCHFRLSVADVVSIVSSLEGSPGSAIAMLLCVSRAFLGLFFLSPIGLEVSVRPIGVLICV